MSAHETTPGQARSSGALTTSKPRRLGKLGGPSFSGRGFAGVGSSRTEPSQPCSNKYMMVARQGNASLACQCHARRPNFGSMHACIA